MSIISERYIGNRMVVYNREYNDYIWNVDHNI